MSIVVASISVISRYTGFSLYGGGKERKDESNSLEERA